jgi:hypothetical protein
LSISRRQMVKPVNTKYLGRLWAFEPFLQVGLAESPLPANLKRRYLAALGPKAQGSGRYAKPLRDRSRSKQWF